MEINDIEIQSIAKVISNNEIAETTEETRMAMTDIRDLIAHERTIDTFIRQKDKIEGLYITNEHFNNKKK